MNRGLGATLGNRKDIAGDADLDLEEIMNYMPGSTLTPRSPANRGVPDAVQQQYQEDMHDMLDDISMPNQSMTMSNLSQISQSPFRGGGATPSRPGAFNNPGQQPWLAGPAESGAKLSAYMNQLGAAQSQPSLDVANLNSNYQPGQHNNERLQHKDDAQNMWGPPNPVAPGLMPSQQALMNAPNSGQERAQVLPDASAALDIRELSIEEPTGDLRGIGSKQMLMRAQTDKGAEGSPEFRRKFADTEEEIPKNSSYTNTMQDRNLPGGSGKTPTSRKAAEEPSQMVSARSNNIGFRMDLDTTPARADTLQRGEGTGANADHNEAGANKTHNRTFADSVLLQGMIGKKHQFSKGKDPFKGDQSEFEEPKAEDASPLSARRAQFGQFNYPHENAASRGAAALDPNSFISKADMSGISTLTAAPTNQFRMAMPKTPDRVDSKSIGKLAKQRDSLADGSAIMPHKKDFGRDGANDEDGVSQLGLSQLDYQKDFSKALQNNNQSEGDDLQGNGRQSLNLDKSELGALSDISALYPSKSPFVMKFNANQEEENSHGVADIQSKNSGRGQKKEQTNTGEDKELQEAVINSKAAAPTVEGGAHPEQELMRNFQQSETQKLRVELSMLHAQMNKMKITLSEKTEQLKYQESQHSQTLREVVDLKGKIHELQDQNGLLQQSKKDHSQLPSFLSRAQDNARKDILTLKHQLDQKEQLVSKLSRELDQEQNKDLLEQSGFQQQIAHLCEQIDKEKLLSASLKKQTTATEARLTEEMEKMRQSYEAEFQDLMGKLHQMEQYVQQIVKEYAEKEGELQNVLEEQGQLRSALGEAERVGKVLEMELGSYKERCQVLEKELEIKGKPGSGAEQKQMRDMEFELKQIRESHQKQLASVKEENMKLQGQLQQVQAKVKHLEADPLESKLLQRDDQVRDLESLLSQIQVLVGSQEDFDIASGQPLLGDLQRIAESAEEASILKQEYEGMKARYAEQDTQVQEAESQVQKLKRELQTLQRQQSQGPSSFTKNLLLEKDKEILALKADQSKDRKKLIEAEDQLWHAQRELETLTVKANESEKVLQEYELSMQRDRELVGKLQMEIKEYEEQVANLKLEIASSTTSLRNQMLEKESKGDEERQRSVDLEKKYFEAQQLNDELEEKIAVLQQQQLEQVQEQHELHVDLMTAAFDIKPAARVRRLDVGVQCREEIPESDSKEEMSILNREIERMNNELKQRGQSHESEVADLNTQIDQLVKDHAELQNEQVAFDLRCLELEKENKLLANAMQEKESTLEILNLEQDQLQQQITQLQENESRLLSELHEANRARSSETLTSSNKVASFTKSTQTDDKDERALESLNDALEAKEGVIQQLERRLADLTQQIDGYRENEEKFMEEAQILQDTATEELKKRADEMERMRAAHEAEIRDKEDAHRKHIQEMTVESEQKMKEMETHLVQNELQASLVAQRRQNEEKIESLQSQHREELDKVRKQSDEKLKRLTADGDREARQHREEQERVRKQGEERVKRMRVEQEQALARAELSGQESLAAAQQKAKKDLKNAQEKAKAEMKNAVDDVKNEMARAKADWERERKKLLQDHEMKITDTRNEVEDQYEEKIRQAKEQSDKMFKKRLQEKEELWQGKFEEIEKEIQGSAEEHRQELRSERERQRIELQEVEAGYQTQIEQLANQLRSQLTPEPTAAIPEKPPTSETGSQTEDSAPKDPEEAAKQALKLSEQQMQIMQQEIEQIKEQYNQKLEKTIQGLKQTQKADAGSTSSQGNGQISQFGKILHLEFEKILLSLKMKSQNLRQDQLNQKRNEINKQISKIISLDKNGLKKHVDDVKKKISEVLMLFKESLEEKTAKRIKELEDSVDALSKQLQDNAKLKDDLGNKSEDPIPQKYMTDNLKNQPEKSGRSHITTDEHNKSNDSEEFGILQKLEPQVTNSKGKIVVEVEKVFKDLLVLYRAMIASKFFKLCLATNSKPTDFPDERAFSEPASQEQIVRHYRELQNFIFKLIAKLNSGAEQLERGENEVYRLKLLNQQVREECWKLKNQNAERELDQSQVRELLHQIQADHMLMNMLSEQSHSLLGKIQELQPSLEQLLHHQKCLVELFTMRSRPEDGDGKLLMNRNCAEINQRCQLYLDEINDGAHNIASEEDPAQAYATESPRDAKGDPQRPALQYNPNKTNMGDFTIQNSFVDHQPALEGQGNAPHAQPQQTHASVASSEQPQNNMLNLDTISQDQAVDLLAKVFQKLNLAPQSQTSAGRNDQEQFPMNQNWMTGNPANNTEDYIVMNATAPSASLLGGPGSQFAHANVYASQQYQRSGQPMARMHQMPQAQNGHDSHRSNNMVLDVTDSSQIHLANRNPAAGNLGGSLDQSNLMDNTLQSAFANNQTIFTQNNAPGGPAMKASNNKNEDCIQQAESLLRMFKQGTQYTDSDTHRRGSMAAPANVGERMQATMTSANSKGHGANRQGENVQQNVFASLNLPLQKAQKARMGSTAAVAGTRLATADHSMLSHQQQSTTQRGYGQRQNAAPMSSFRNVPSQGHNSHLEAHIIDLSSSANFRSLDHSAAGLAKTEYNLSTAVGQGHPVPPLELKFQGNAKENDGTGAAHSEYTAGLKENPVILSQQRQPSESRELGKATPALNTADEYYKYHKKLRNNKSQVKDERRKSSQVQLQRIEGVVSPISSHKQRGAAGEQQRYESIHSAQMELKPPSHQMHRTNSVNSSSLQQQRALQNQFQTVEVHGASGRQHMSKKHNAQRPNLPRHANQRTLRKDHAFDGDVDNHRTLSQQHLDDSVELNKQTIPFRKDQQLHQMADNARNPGAYLDSTHEASLDDMRHDEAHDVGSHNQRQRRGAPKYYSHFQTIQDEANAKSANDRARHGSNATLQRNLKSIDAHDNRKGHQFFEDDERREADERSSQKETIQMYQDRHEDEVGPYHRHHGEDQHATKQPHKRARPPRYHDHDDDAAGLDGAAHNISSHQKAHPLQPRGDHSQRRGDRYQSGSRGAHGPAEGGQSKYSQARNSAAENVERPVKQRREERRPASSSDSMDY